MPKRVRTTWLASRHSHAFLIHLSELFTTRSSGRPIRFPRIVTPTGRGKTAHAVNAHAPVGNVDSHVRWKLFLLCMIFEVNHFIRQKQAFISTRKFIGGLVPWVRENSEVNPKLISGPMKQKICPRIGFRSCFSQCVDYMRFNEKSFCFRWQETTKLMLFCNTKTSSLVLLCDLRYLTGNTCISSVMTKHMGVQRKLHRFAYLIVQIILCFYS